jgi:hypothetical protein
MEIAEVLVTESTGPFTFECGSKSSPEEQVNQI